MPATLSNEQFTDLSTLWETLVTGNPLPHIKNVKLLKAAMWQDLQKSFLSLVLPHKKLTRDFKLEKQLTLARSKQERSGIEIALLQDYSSQLHGQKFSWASTPLMSQKMEWGLDCVSSSLLLASLLTSLNIKGKVWLGLVIGHVMLIYYDLLGRGWFVDSRNNRMFLLSTAPEEKPGGKVYRLVDDDYKQLQSSFKLLHSFSVEDACLLFILGNFEGRQKGFFTPESPDQQLYDSYQDILGRQHWADISYVLCPEAKMLRDEEWHEEYFQMTRFWAERFDNIDWN